ncbi:M1 family metallopeptidase [Biomaibacter acetigenes]|uniref:M1 family metallopeptidase n=1 Tax=Biomaibacter acetigenes TaxID=2316383 RepID=UPI001FE8EC60|nr:M1 family metallopeptidase [Biomaibacter acetigenes]
MDFDPDEKRIEGTQEVIIKNTEMVELTELYFHLYPNAFKTPDAAPFPKTEFASAYPDGFSPGYINIKKVTGVSGPLEYEVEDTILKVVLDKPLKPQQQIKLTLEFTEVIPPSYGRFGYGQNTYNIANWYPILAVYDENGWNKDPYYAVGDPFYSDVGLYEVKIKAPKEYTIAAGGSLSDKKQDGAYNIWTFKTGLVRDFAWVAGSKFQTASDMVDGVKITSFYMKEDAVYGKKALEYAKKAIKFYSEYFAKYPYKEYTVAASDFYIGGMEYPNLVMIGRQFYNDGDLLEYVVVHETAHQWWVRPCGQQRSEGALVG